jgi:SulP family sulfate permease
VQLIATFKFLDTKIPTIRGRPFFQEIAANAKSGATVALVSLPLSISLAIAADASPVQGIITACWAGLVSAIAGGSHYNIVGPTGAS